MNGGKWSRHVVILYAPGPLRAVFGKGRGSSFLVCLVFHGRCFPQIPGKHCLPIFNNKALKWSLETCVREQDLFIVGS